MSFVRVNDVVFTDGHGVTLDVFSDAFGVARLKIEADRVGCVRRKHQQKQEAEQSFDHDDIYD